MSPFVGVGSLAPSLLQYALFLGVVTLLVRPVGGYLARVFADQPTWLDPVLRPPERWLYRLCSVDPQHEMGWREYAICFVGFGLLSVVLIFLIVILQPFLPWFDPRYVTTLTTPDLALNVAISFSTTTTWQPYPGETTMGYFAQTVGLTTGSFLAGAAGLAVGIAFIRGLVRQRVTTLGNFWADVTRALLWVLLPVSIVGSLFLVWQGVPLNYQPYTVATTLEGAKQMIPQGPVAALEFVENLGTNGGGFFNVNGAHPFQNPTALTNLVEMLAIVVIPAALTNTFGRMVHRAGDGWVLYWAMVLLFVLGLAVAGWAEQAGNPLLARTANVDVSASALQSGGNMEGKEVRFGVGGSVLTAVVTSNTATGSTNSQHDSYTPIGGMVPLVNMLLGELIFGGLGTGIYSIVIVALLALFLAGLMVGRTPQYLGKRLEPGETKLVMLYVIVAPIGVLVLTASASVLAAGLAGLTTNQGPHGFSEILYAYASTFANNGQAFAGLSANSVFYNMTTALVMLMGRFGLAVPALALAGLLAQQPRRRASLGTLPTASLTFGALLVGTILIVGALSYFPALALGPIVEQLRLASVG